MHAVDNNEPLPKISILTAINMLTAAWNKVSETTAKIGVKKAGNSKESPESALNDADDPFKELN